MAKKLKILMQLLMAKTQNINVNLLINDNNNVNQFRRWNL